MNEAFKDKVLKILAIPGAIAIAMGMALGMLGLIALPFVPWILLAVFIKVGGGYLYAQSILSFSPDWTVAWIFTGVVFVIAVFLKPTIKTKT